MCRRPSQASIANCGGSLKAVETNKEATQNAKEELDEIAQENTHKKVSWKGKNPTCCCAVTAFPSKPTAQRKGGKRIAARSGKG